MAGSSWKPCRLFALIVTLTLDHGGERTDTLNEVVPSLEGTDERKVPFADCLLAGQTWAVRALFSIACDPIAAL